MKSVAGILLIILMGCESGMKAKVPECSNYRPACYAGGNLQCHRNSDGCESCSCIMLDNPNFKGYQPGQ